MVYYNDAPEPPARTRAVSSATSLAAPRPRRPVDSALLFQSEPPPVSSDDQSQTRRRKRVTSTPFLPTDPPPRASAEPSKNARQLPPSARSFSSGTPVDRQSGSTNHGREHLFQPFPRSGESDAWSSHSKTEPRERARSMLSATSTRNNRKSSRGAGADTASESGVSVLSAFHRPSTREDKDVRKRHEKAKTASPLRTWARWMAKSGRAGSMVPLAIALVLLVKWLVGVGDYSGLGTPPLRGDFEAQRHWLALTSSSLLPADSSQSVPYTAWYYRDLPYWGLDYPPVTAYHSYLLGAIARLSTHTSPFVTLRPPSGASAAVHQTWEQVMSRLEREGEMKAWMRATVIATDALLWISAVAVFCRANHQKAAGDKGVQSMVVALLTILLQPALLLIDNGHFQYNSAMMGLSLWAVNLFQANHHLLGAVAFVLSLGFKQMALYYSPAIFAYLLGRCLWLRGRDGTSFFFRLGLTTIAAFVVVFLPFLSPPSLLLQVIARMFPFSRGLFEDKVANFWCALNTVVKLRRIADVGTLAKLALVATLLAILPGVAGMLWVSHQAGLQDVAEPGTPKGTDANPLDALSRASKPTPTVILLPHALFTSAMAFFLFSFQVHEKSILLPLMPLTVLMGGREAGFGRMDWEWAVLMNNVGTFSMWPLLQRDGLGLQYVALLVLWNVLIGYNPYTLRSSFVKWLSLWVYLAIFLLHFIEHVATPPAHLPDIFAVANLTLSATVFGIGFLWGTKRSVQEGWVVGSFHG